MHDGKALMVATLMAVICATACGGDTGPTRSQAASRSYESPASRTAVANAYEALSSGDLERIDELLADLDHAVESDPTDGYTMFYSGSIRLWEISERAITEFELSELVTQADEMMDRMQRAHELRPDDFRMTSFLGLTQVNVGVVTRDAALVDLGLSTLQTGIEQHPAYGHFLRAIATARLPKSDPLFTGTLADMEALAQACALPAGEHSTYRYPDEPLTSPFPAICLNEGVVPHVFEGYMIAFGDIVLKATGDVARARALYASAKTAPGYGDWPFSAMLDARIAEAETRAAAYLDDVPLNDPPVWSGDGHICVGCHQEAP